MPIGKITYSSAAGFIRERAMQAAYSKLNQGTQRERARKAGEMHAYVSALEILLRSPEARAASLATRSGTAGAARPRCWKRSSASSAAGIA